MELFDRMKQTLENLENRVLRSREQKERQITNQLNQIYTAFLPDEMMQERYLSVIYYLNKFGPGFVDILFSNLEADNFEHQFLYLE